MAAHAKATNLAPTVETVPVTIISAPMDRVSPNPANPRGDHYDLVSDGHGAYEYAARTDVECVTCQKDTEHVAEWVTA